MKITFRKKIENISLQVGDTAYFVTPNATGFATSSPKLIGKIDKVRDYNIVIDNVTNSPSTDDFIMFSKDPIVNNSSLLGYYAEVKLLNNSTEKAELFALGSEITQSSK
tara:strand:+ start:475 stop:801 length:327 start_codon:yes stop_codon:yes gene_type:complete